ncbi:hypothetical protein PM085_15730 [Halorubrum ezzemoulense]|uniref:Uncharacterized protein n=1 Tax=Halorubrum ezzemoulense TaxID=337243 RepID=A0ABT4Z6K5_HALEZ|nr:hypothetical protein [Halorubrum ezzemoulense]MDB2293707.1 hypothetical protein [Halorubrum ezzemoulense]
MSSDRAPPERARPSGETTDGPSGDDEVDASPERRREVLSEVITMEPGARKARGEKGIERMIIEAELVAEGHEPDNPAVPVSVEAGEKLRERLDEHDEDLVPAWTRPWEGADE